MSSLPKHTRNTDGKSVLIATMPTHEVMCVIYQITGLVKANVERLKQANGNAYSQHLYNDGVVDAKSVARQNASAINRVADYGLEAFLRYDPKDKNTVDLNALALHLQSTLGRSGAIQGNDSPTLEATLKSSPHVQDFFVDKINNAMLSDGAVLDAE